MEPVSCMVMRCKSVGEVRISYSLTCQEDCWSSIGWGPSPAKLGLPRRAETISTQIGAFEESPQSLCVRQAKAVLYTSPFRRALPPQDPTMVANALAASLIRSPFTPSWSEPSRICTASHRVACIQNVGGRRGAPLLKVEQAAPRGQSIVVRAENAQTATDAGDSLHASSDLSRI